MGHLCLESSMNDSAHLAPRYEALFRVSDCLRVYRDIEELFRVLPLQLHPVLDFDYMSVFLNSDTANGAHWYVLDGDDEPALTPSRDVPFEQAHVSWAFEHQKPAVIQQLDQGLDFLNPSHFRPARSPVRLCLAHDHRAAAAGSAVSRK